MLNMPPDWSPVNVATPPAAKALAERERRRNIPAGPRVVSVDEDPTIPGAVIITYSEPVAPDFPARPGQQPQDPPLEIPGLIIADVEEDGPTRIRCYMDDPNLPANAPLALSGRRWNYAGGSRAVTTVNGQPFAAGTGIIR